MLGQLLNTQIEILNYTNIKVLKIIFMLHLENQKAKKITYLVNVYDPEIKKIIHNHMMQS